MKDQVLENYGVRVTATVGGVRYTLPWMKHTELKESGWGLLLVSAMPCAVAFFLPVVVMKFVLPGMPLFDKVFFAIFSLVWWSILGFFTCLFGAMAYSALTKWGRARIWVNDRRIAAAQLRGSESRVAYVYLGKVVEISTIPDGVDRTNPATPGRLVVCLNNDVSRLVGGYPLELLEALREDVMIRVQQLRLRR